MLNATWQILLDVNGDGSYAADISPYFYQAQWTIGRDNPSLLRGRSTAGLLTLGLRNSDGRFNPYNTSSPYYGNLLPGRKIKIIGSYGGSSYTKYVGFLDSIQPAPDLSGQHTATLRALGPLSIPIAADATTVPMQTNIYTGVAVNAVLDAIGWASGDRVIDSGATILARWWLDAASPMNALQDVETTEFGFLGETQDGKIFFEDRNHRTVTSRCNAVQAVFSDAPGSTLKYQVINPLDSRQSIANLVTVDVVTYSVGALATLWLVSGVPSLAAGASADFWASAGSGVDSWTTPAPTTDYLANAAPDGSGTDLTSSLTITVSKFASSMKITIQNTAGVTAYLTRLQARGAPLVASDPVTIKAEDTTSEGQYGQRKYPIATKWIPSIPVAQGYTEFVKDQFKSAMPLQEITFLANRGANYLNESLARQISDRITLIATGIMKLGIYQDFWVESVTHRLTAKHEHYVTYSLSPAQIYGTAWILGVSVLGTDSILSSRW
jgi:hypothetical protein